MLHQIQFISTEHILKKLFEYLQVTDIDKINQNYLNHIRQTYNYTSSSIANKYTSSLL